MTGTGGTAGGGGSAGSGGMGGDGGAGGSAGGVGGTAGAGGAGGTAGSSGSAGGAGTSGSGATGTLDPSFGGSGFVVYHNAAAGNRSDLGYGISTDVAGKILVAGQSWNGSDPDMAIWRYDTDGTLDPNFGSGGVVVHHSAAGGDLSDWGYGISTDAAGKILVTGGSHNDRRNFDMIIWRYAADGTLDPDFGAGGIVVHHGAAGGNGDDYGYGITIDAAGKVLVTGSSRNAWGDQDVVIWRYNPDGTLDPSFGASGFVVHDSAAGGEGPDHSRGIVIDAAGKILVTGWSRNARGDLDMVIWRYDPDGTLDPSFGAGGFVVHDSAAGGEGSDYGYGILTDAAGKILVTGESQNANNNDMVIWRYDPNGTLDPSFGAGGIVVHDDAAGGSGHDRGRGVTTNATGKILVTGQSENANNSDMVIWRYDPDGTLDPSFGAGGIVVHDSAAGGGGDDYGNAITIDAAGKILVGGASTSAGGDWDMVAWRYK